MSDRETNENVVIYQEYNRELATISTANFPDSLHVCKHEFLERLVRILRVEAQ